MASSLPKACCGCDYPIVSLTAIWLTRQPRPGETAVPCIRFVDCLYHGPQRYSCTALPEYRDGLPVMREVIQPARPRGKKANG